MTPSFAQSIPFYRHLILCSTGLVVGLTAFNLFYFQQIVFRDLFIPSVLWAVFLGLGIAVCYGSWVAWSYWHATRTDRSSLELLRLDVFSYLPLYALPGTWLNHFGVPVALFLIVALAGFMSLKLWSGHFSSKPMVWDLSPTAAWYLLIAVMITSGVAFTFLGVNRFLAFNAYGDFSIFIQQIWGFSQFEMLLVGGRGFLPFGNHFSPILILFAPFYRLWDHPGLLIFLQNFILVLGAIPVYLMAVDSLRSPVAGLTLGVAYLLYPALQHSAVGDFHESLLLATPLLYTFMYLKRQNHSRFVVCCVLAVMCKEDATLPVGMLGAYTWWKEGEKRLGFGVMVGALVWFAVSFWVIMPYYQGFQGWYLGFITGSGSGEVSTGIPFATRIAAVFSIKSMIFLLQLLIPLAGLAVLGPLELLIGLPTFLELQLYAGPPFGLVGTIYTWHSVAVIPAIFIAAIASIHVIKEWAGHQGLLIALMAILLSSLSTSILYGVLPYSPRFSYSNYQITRHDELGHTLLKQIPPDASVTTTSQLSTHLSNRTDLFVFPLPWEKEAWAGPIGRRPVTVDYVVADTSAAVLKQASEGHAGNLLQLIRKLCADPAYTTVAAEDGYVILKHNPSASP